MANKLSGAILVIGAAAGGALAVMAAARSTAQPSAYVAPRTADGKPDLNGIWQAVNTANWDVQDHQAQGGLPQMGAIGAIPPGQGVVEGNEIPYKPAAAAKRM